MPVRIKPSFSSSFSKNIKKIGDFGRDTINKFNSAYKTIIDINKRLNQGYDVSKKYLSDSSKSELDKVFKTKSSYIDELEKFQSAFNDIAPKFLSILEQ